MSPTLSPRWGRRGRLGIRRRDVHVGWAPPTMVARATRWTEKWWAKPTLHGLCFVFCLLLSIPARADDAPAKENEKLPLLFHEDFKSPDDALKKFTFTDKDAWRIVKDDVNGGKQNVLSLFKQSNYKPPVRSPLNIAWINDLKISRFVLEAKCRITTELIPHRDLCFFLAGVDASHMIYCHASQQEDKIHNQIHLVDGKDREPITVKHAKGTPWDDKYHTVK